MGNLWRNLLKYFGLYAFLLTISIVIPTTICNDIPNLHATSTTPPKTQTGSSCSNKQRLLLLVSTLDGRVSALNLQQGGTVEWSISTGTNPLLSASISNLEIAKDGRVTRLIPSLDGSLYQFDGDSIEAMPFTAETLLSASQRLNEESMVVGGKDSMTYGISSKTGEMKYVCHMSGCKKFADEAMKDGDDLIVIRRNTQTVRAVEMRTGNENWNFSVGHHDITYLHSKKSKADQEEVTINTSDQESNNINDNERLKVFIPNGLVVVVDKENPSKVIWQHKFDKPIAKAWTVKNGKVEEVSMFDYRNVPALVGKQKPGSMEESPSQPLLYLGSYENQMYVQPSKRMSEEINRIVHKYASGSSTELIPMPRVKWQPYLASASSRTPIIYISKRKQIAAESYPATSKGALIIRNDMEYPFDNGYYLFADQKPIIPLIDDDIEEEPSIVTVINGSFWHWWKEVIAVSITTSILVHMFIGRYLNKHVVLSCEDTTSEKADIPGGTGIKRSSEGFVTESLVKPPLSHFPISGFTSRYYSDFEPIRCLGAGGFGIVFEAKNKIDECHYAIKRIGVKNSDKAKEKVMREARALAKLDHIGIVRYHQVWIETPPSGWQEEKDREFISDVSHCNTPYGSTAASPVQSPGVELTNESILHNEKNLKESNVYSFPKSQIQSSLPKNIENSPHKWRDLDNDESGSFSMGVGSLEQNHYGTDSSFEVVFKNSDSESSSNHPISDAMDIPFKHYTRQVKERNAIEEENVLFDDSGCAVKGSHSNDGFVMKDYSESDTSSLKCVVIGNQSSVDWTESQSKLNSSVTSSSVQRPSSLLLKSDKGEVSLQLSPDQPLKLYLYIQMQLCKPESLKDWLNNNTLNRDRNYLLDIFDQIVSAVDYVHDCGLMHRDLKPSNIFFSMDGIVKIGDFGLVTHMEDQSEFKAFDFNGKDHTDQVGTHIYMSPEQIAGRSYDYKVDIYSLGLIFLELMYPFATQMERIMVLSKARQQKFSVRFHRELPAERKFVNWLLTKNPADRPDIKDIQSSDMMKNIQPVHRTRSRTRTTSSSSNGSS